MTLPVVVALEAERQARTIDRWWRTNRSAAPDLFRDEFAAALELIGLAPLAGRRYRGEVAVDARRVLLRSTRYHVYYTVRESDALVVAVWSSVRGTGPDLRP
jgi:plasmid stabilization system protein ParE